MLVEIIVLLYCLYMTNNLKEIKENVDYKTHIYGMVIIKCNKIHKTENKMTN